MRNKIMISPLEVRVKGNLLVTVERRCEFKYLRSPPYCVVMRGIADWNHDELPLLPPMPCRVGRQKVQHCGLSSVPKLPRMPEPGALFQAVTRGNLFSHRVGFETPKSLLPSPYLLHLND
jgi:hypothetical protein